MIVRSLGFPPAPHLRASDADRERIAAFLKRHCVEGRLTPDELSERLERAYGARTLGDLARLTTDLPRVEPDPPPRRVGRPVAAVFAAAALALVAAAALPSALPWIAVLLGALGVIAVTLVFSIAVSVAPIVAIVAGTVWAVRRLWPGTRRPLPPLP